MGLTELLQLPHFPVMLSAVIFLTLSLVMVILHKPKQWFRIHVIFAATGGILTIIGLIILAGFLLTLNHAILGVITFSALIGTLIIGSIAVKTKVKNLRLTHIWMSRVVYIITLVTVVLGISFFFLI